MAGESERHPFLLSVQDVAKHLETDIERGLTSAQVAQFQEKYPPNKLNIGGAIPWYTIFLRQLFNAMILVRFSQLVAIMMNTHSCVGAILCYGTEFRCTRLRRGWRPCCRHLPQRFYWLLSRVWRRKKDGGS